MRDRPECRRGDGADGQLKPLAAIEDSAEIIPAAVEFVDIAGLVAGASQGEGMGNKFLGHIREVMRWCRWYAALRTVKSITSPAVSIPCAILKRSPPS